MPANSRWDLIQGFKGYMVTPPAKNPGSKDSNAPKRYVTHTHTLSCWPSKTCAWSPFL